MTIDLFFNEASNEETQNDIIDTSNFKEWDENETFKFLVKCDEAYYIDNGREPIVDDLTYDLIRSHATEKWSSNEYFESVGTLPTSSEKVTHPYILGSLTKTKSDPNSSTFVEKWLTKHKGEYIVITPKFDGLSIYSHYADKKLESSATRGDGRIGQDITNKAKHFNIGCTSNAETEARGEIVMPGDDYKKLNYRNRRNGASGIISRDDLLHVGSLRPLYYELISSSEVNVDDLTEEERMFKLLELFGPHCTTLWTKEKVENVDVGYLISLLTKWKLEFEDICDLDGLVLTLNNSSRENEYYPINKVAFKVNEEGVEVTVAKVEWNTSRTGRIVPKVILTEGVELSGATVSQATGHNAGYIRDNGITTGTKIKIVRSGEVVPYITEVLG